MSAATLPYQFESWQTHCQIRFLPGLNAVPWADIEKVGAEVLGEVERRHAKGYLIDLTPLDHMGSAVVALIVRIWKAVKKDNGKITVVCNNKLVLQVITLAGLDKVWTIVETKEEGLKALGVKSTSGTGAGIVLWILALLGAITTGAGIGLHIAPNNIDPNAIPGLVYGGAGVAALLGLLSTFLVKGAGRWVGLLSLIVGALGAAGFYLKWFDNLAG